MPRTAQLLAFSCGLVSMATACVEGRLDAAGGSAFAPTPPGSVPPGVEGACVETPECPPELTCVAGTCLRLCVTAEDCPLGECRLYPGGAVGRCVMSRSPDGPSDGAEPLPEEPSAPDPVAPEPPPDDEGPLPEDEPPPEAKPPEDDSVAPEPDAPPPPNDPADPTPEDEAPVPPPPATEPPDAQAPPEEPEAPDPPDPPPAPAPDCVYPQAGPQVRLGRTMPQLGWPGALDMDGNAVPFDLESFHCDPVWSRYSVAAFVIGTGWCSACAEYLETIAPDAAAFEAAGGLFVFVEVETADYGPATNDDAHRIVRRHAGAAPGLRVGDAETRPVQFAVRDMDIVSSYPTAFVVRRSDMQVIYDQHREAYTLDYPAIARDAAGGPPPMPGLECVEEPAEPNDSTATATTLEAAELVGGVCNDRPDFFRLTENGRWALDLRFRHADGDLDLYLWDEARNAPARTLAGRLIGSDSADDDERLEGSGPAIVQVIGYEGAVAPYRIRVTPN